MYTNEGKGDDAIALYAAVTPHTFTIERLLPAAASHGSHRYREFLRSHTHVGVMCALGSALVARSDSVGALGVYMLALGVDPTNARVKLAIDQVTVTKYLAAAAAIA